MTTEQILLFFLLGLMLINIFAKEWILAVICVFVGWGLSRQLIAAIAASSDPTKNNPLWWAVYAAWFLCVAEGGFALALVSGKKKKRGY